MGRPSKQKQIVAKYFKKHLQNRGKLDCHECIYCCQTFANNSWRMDLILGHFHVKLILKGFYSVLKKKKGLYL
jgi:hypothetical protein